MFFCKTEVEKEIELVRRRHSIRTEIIKNMCSVEKCA